MTSLSLSGVDPEACSTAGLRCERGAYDRQGSDTEKVFRLSLAATK